MSSRESLEKRLDRVISPIMHEGTPGMALLIARGNEVVHRKAYGMADLEKETAIRCDDNFVIASNTKQFTCMAIMMLKEQGLLTYDEPIARFFPDFPEYRKYVTIRQLMNHQSGISEYFEEEKWKRWKGAERANTDKMLGIIKTFGHLDFDPGTQYAYSNSAYVMLGNIVEQLSGMSFGSFLEKKILQPVGMTRSLVPDYMDHRSQTLIEGYTLQEDGSFAKQDYDMILVGYADGNMQSNVDDLWKWHQFVYKTDSELLMKRETMKDAFCENFLKDGTATGYGFGLFLGSYEGHREVWHTGGTKGFISRCSRYIDDDLSIIMLTNYEGLPKNQLYEEIAAEVFAE